MKTKDNGRIIDGFLKLPPDRINYEMGRYYLNKGDLSSAITDFYKLIMTSPGNPLGYLYRAKAYFTGAAFLSACEDLTKAIELDPKLTTSWLYRGCCYEELERYGEAISDYSEVVALRIEKQSGWDYVFRNRAPSYYNSGIYGFASPDYIDAISFDVDYSRLFYHRGLSYGRLGETKLAIADFEAALAIKPDNIHAYACLAEILSQKEGGS